MPLAPHESSILILFPLLCIHSLSPDPGLSLLLVLLFRAGRDEGDNDGNHEA